MTEDTAIKLALTSGLLNYMDNETPRHYLLMVTQDLKR